MLLLPQRRLCFGKQLRDPVLMNGLRGSVLEDLDGGRRVLSVQKILRLEDGILGRRVSLGSFVLGRSSRWSAAKVGSSPKF